MFNYDSPIWKFLNKICDIVVLGLIWGFCSIPVFTIGASTTALYYTMMKIVKDEEGYPTVDFFKSFKQNFKQSTISWIIILIVAILLFLDLKFYGSVDKTTHLILYYFVTFLSILCAMITLYIFPLIARFDNTIKNFFKISVLMAIKHFLWTLLLFGISAVIFFLSILIPFISIFSISLMAFIHSYIFNHIFSFYKSKNEENKENEE